MSDITVHTLVRDDENYVGYAVESVIAHVDRVIVFDTGSTDRTVAVVERVAAAHPGKVVLEQKGACDKARHTELRQEMLDRTATGWFMILDGDEVWTDRGIREAAGQVASAAPQVEFLFAPYYNCVGDIYHDYLKQAHFKVLGRSEPLMPRLVRADRGFQWRGEYDADILATPAGQVAFHTGNSVVLSQKYWHMTHLRRSSTDDANYSSGASRRDKRRPTYLGIGRRIQEPVPEVFDDAFQSANRLSIGAAALNAVGFAAGRVTASAGAWWRGATARQS